MNLKQIKHIWVNMKRQVKEIVSISKNLNISLFENVS